MNEIITSLKDKGHTVEGVDFPYLDFVVPAYYVMTTAEVVFDADARAVLGRHARVAHGGGEVVRSSEATVAGGLDTWNLPESSNS